jgi:hypothetical protein
MKPLICADCRFYLKSEIQVANTNFDRCQASEKIHLVTGEKTYAYCESMRTPSGPCGLDAKLFELNISDEENIDGI